MVCCHISSSLTYNYHILSNLEEVGVLMYRNSIHGLQQPLFYAMTMSPCVLFADTALHHNEMGKGAMLEVSHVPWSCKQKCSVTTLVDLAGIGWKPAPNLEAYRNHHF
jgi:hypothetical protein